MQVAVEPKTKADQEKMGVALNRLAKEDPSFRYVVFYTVLVLYTTLCVLCMRSVLVLWVCCVFRLCLCRGNMQNILCST